MSNSVRMRSILEVVFAELREKSEQLNSSIRGQGFRDLKTIHGITIDYEREKYFIDTLNTIVFLSRHHTYKIPLGGLAEEELSVFFEEVKAFVAAFSTRIPMETLSLMDVHFERTIGQATESIDLGDWIYLGNGRFEAKSGAMLSQLTQYVSHEDLTWQNHRDIFDIDGNKRTDTNYDSLYPGEVVHFASEVIQASSIEARLAELGYEGNASATYVYLNGTPSAEESEERSYLEKSLNQFLKGNYTDDVTLLGTGGQIVAGFFGVDLPMDIRDTVHNLKNWEWTWGHVGQTLLDGIGLIPIIGVIKYADEIGALLKGAKASDVLKHTDEVVDVGTGAAAKVTKEAAEEIPTAFRQTEFASSYKQRMDQTPTGEGAVKYEGARGESMCILNSTNPEIEAILKEAGVDGIQYKNGIPDFSPTAKVELEIERMYGGKGDFGRTARAENFKQAEEVLAKQLNDSPELAKQFGMEAGNITANDMRKYRIANELTWHELSDAKTMQLVPTEINGTFGHLGGVGEINAGAYSLGGIISK